MQSNTSPQPQGRRAHAPGLLPLALAGDSEAIRGARGALEQPGAAPLLILADEGLDLPAIARYVHDRTRAARCFSRTSATCPRRCSGASRG